MSKDIKVWKQMICLANGSDAKKRGLPGAVQERKEGREGRKERRKEGRKGKHMWGAVVAEDKLK